MSQRVAPALEQEYVVADRVRPHRARARPVLTMTSPRASAKELEGFEERPRPLDLVVDVLDEERVRVDGPIARRCAGSRDRSRLPPTDCVPRSRTRQRFHSQRAASVDMRSA